MKSILAVVCSAAVASMTAVAHIHAAPTDNYQNGIVGSWLGTLTVPGTELRVVFHIAEGDDGALTATMDSPDQGANGIPVSEVTFADGHVKLVSAAVGGEFEGDMSEDGSQIVGEWRQGGVTLPLTLERTEEEIATPVRPQEPQPPFPYAAEDVVYPNEAAGIQLAGTLTLPQGAGPHPAVVLISGSGPQDRDETVMGHRPFLVLSDHLTRQGIAVLRFDDRGVAESTGDFTTATSKDFATDVLAGVDYLLSRDDIDARNIGLIGHSEGGLVAPMVAVQSADVAFIVLMAGPGVTGEEIILEQSQLISRAAGRDAADIQEDLEINQKIFDIVKQESDREIAAQQIEELLRTAAAAMTPEEMEEAGITEDNLDAQIQAQVQQVNSVWVRFFLTYDPAPTLAKVSVPVLALNGELDLQVSPDQNLTVIEQVLRDNANPHFTIRELPGLNHLFQTAGTGAPSEYTTIEETIAPEALELMSNWILERVGR